MTFLRMLNNFRYSNSKLSRYSIPEGKNISEHVNLAYVAYESTSSETSFNPLVIMHGLFGSKSNWNSLCKKFHEKTKPQRKIVALDARNHGDSPHHQKHAYEFLVLDLKMLLANLEIEKVSLLGHSMGGATAMLFALTYPNLVEKLIVDDISPINIELGNLGILVDAMLNVKIPRGIELSEARAKADFQLLQNGITRRETRKFLLTNLVRKSDDRIGWRLNLSILQASYKNLANFPLEKGKAYEGPTIFIGGDMSNAIKKEDLPRIKTIFPKSEFHFIEGAGHWLHNEKPEEFLNICLEFLNRNEN